MGSIPGKTCQSWDLQVRMEMSLVKSLRNTSLINIVSIIRICFRLALRKLKRPYRMLWDPAQTGEYISIF
jgi:hypothetical protein